MITHYQMPCSSRNFETISRRGQEGAITFDYVCVAEACVQGRNRYTIDHLLSQGYVACKYNYLDLVKELYEGETQLHGFSYKAVGGDALDSGTGRSLL